MTEVIWSIKVIAACGGLVVLAYVLSRAASIAYFRAKLEHYRAVLRETRDEEKD